MKTSKDPRHQARRLAFGYIHAIENAGIGFDDQSLAVLKESTQELLEITHYSEELFDAIISIYNRDRETIIKTITDNSKEWQLAEMYKPDIVVLIIAICEIKAEKVPMKVAIDEAVELAKEFCDVESAKFINGVLAGVVQEIQTIKDDKSKQS